MTVLLLAQHVSKGWDQLSMVLKQQGFRKQPRPQTSACPLGVMQASHNNTDSSFSKTMDPGIALGGSMGPNIIMASDASYKGRSNQFAPTPDVNMAAQTPHKGPDLNCSIASPVPFLSQHTNHSDSLSHLSITYLSIIVAPALRCRAQDGHLGIF